MLFYEAKLLQNLVCPAQNVALIPALVNMVMNFRVP
jgi:hypothetical protein